MTVHDPDDDDVLKDLDAALQVEPSRAFADGVRARVTRSRTNTQRVWWGLAAAASVGLATMSLWRLAVETPSALPSTLAQVASAGAPAVSPDRPDPIVETPGVSRRRTPVARVVVNTRSEPRLEVITNQAALLEQLWTSVGPGATLETAAEVALPVTVVEAKPMAPMVLEPIVVPPIVLTGIGRDSGGAGATPVIRRVQATKETR